MARRKRIPEPTTEIEATQKEYTALQQGKQKLKERKREWQEKLKENLE